MNAELKLQDEQITAIKTTPAKIEFNIASFQASLAEELQKYDVVLSEDMVKEGKDMAKELNRIKTLLDTARKNEVNAASVNIKEFDKGMKTLVTMCKEGRQKILDQIDQYEEKVRVKCRELCEKYALMLYEEESLEEEYRTVDVSDFALASNLTEKGNLTKKAKDGIYGRVRDQRALQDKVKYRLMQLRAESAEAGLKATLTEQQVRPFIHESDEVYQKKIEELIVAELDRQTILEKKIREEVEVENNAPAGAEEPTIPDAPDSPGDSGSSAPVEAPSEVKSEEPAPYVVDGDSIFMTRAEFEITAPSHINVKRIEDKVRNMLEKAGFKTLKSLTVTKRG